MTKKNNTIYLALIAIFIILAISARKVVGPVKDSKKKEAYRITNLKLNS